MVYEQLRETQLIWLWWHYIIVQVLFLSNYFLYILKFSPPNPQIINNYVNGGAHNDSLSPMSDSQMIAIHLELMKV